MIRYGVLVGCVSVLAGCSNMAPSENREAAVQAIKDTEASWSKEVASKDSAKWAAFYTDDGALLMPNAPAISGKDNIQAALKPLLSDPNFALTFSSTKVDVARSGDIGYAEGTYTMTVTDPKTKQPVTDHGKYLTVFKKQEDRKWKAAEDMISSDMPAPGDSH
jgi:uncharacterized protein (TIGR02246 family)